MNEHRYTELPLKEHGRVLGIPAALFGMTILGSMMHVEPFVSYLGWVVAAISTLAAGIFAYQSLNASQLDTTLRINEKTLTFHCGQVPMTLFWREVIGIETGQAADPKTGIQHKRVLIIARKAGTRQQDLDTFAFDYLYGMQPEKLAEVLRMHWSEATEASRLALSGRVLAGNTTPNFGRRAGDKI